MGPSGIRIGSGEGSTMTNFIVCTVHLVRVIKSRRLRWTGDVARFEEGTSAFKILTGTLCQSVSEVYLTGMAALGAVSHRFNFFYL